MNQRPITAEDDRYTFILGFCREQKISRSTLYRFKRLDPSFPAPVVGKRYWRSDLLRYWQRV